MILGSFCFTLGFSDAAKCQSGSMYHLFDVLQTHPSLLGKQLDHLAQEPSFGRSEAVPDSGRFETPV